MPTRPSAMAMGMYTTTVVRVPARMDMSMVAVPVAAASPEIHSLFLAAHAALQHHNGVIHDHADGDDEGRAGHQVDVEAGKVQQDHCQQDGQRHADAHDQAGPQVAEEDEQHDRWLG